MDYSGEGKADVVGKGRAEGAGQNLIV